jgi:formyltetrahydrofolate deformylase
LQANNTYILTIICQDSVGLVAGISGYLYSSGANIISSSQYSAPDTGKFFMRVEYESNHDLTSGFLPIAAKFKLDYTNRNKANKLKTLVMVSKESHCLSHLLHSYSQSELDCEIVGIASNHRDLEYMAAWYHLPFYYIESKDEATLAKIIDENSVELLVLARYMQVLSKDMCDKMSARAINIHHSFLPSFKGANPYKQAQERGVKIIGATAHYITGDLDEGPIIEQEVARVGHNLSLIELKQIGRDIEARVLTAAVKSHLAGKVLLNGIKTVVF